MQWTKTTLFYAYLIGMPHRVIKNYHPLLTEFHLLFLSLLVLAVIRLVWNIPRLKRLFDRQTPVDIKQSKQHHAVSKEAVSCKTSSEYYEEAKNGMDLRFVVLNVVLLVLMCCATYTFSHAHGDFLLTAKMCRLTSEENWDGILQIRCHNEKPMFPIVLFRQLALFKLDRLADEVFAYPTISQADEGRLQGHFSNRAFGDHILFEYGLVNMSFRMAMVQYAMKESTISNLRVLALSAMANEEYEVAEKYLRLIGQSTFYRRWAQNHREYIDFRRQCDQADQTSLPREMIAIADKMNAIRRLMPVVNEIESNVRLDAVISRGYLRENIEEANPEVRKMFLVQLLMYKDLETFRKYFDLWSEDLFPAGGIQTKTPGNNRIPRHFQEALVIGATTEEVDARVARYGLSPDLGRNP